MNTIKKSATYLYAKGQIFSKMEKNVTLETWNTKHKRKHEKFHAELILITSYQKHNIGYDRCMGFPKTNLSQ